MAARRIGLAPLDAAEREVRRAVDGVRSFAEEMRERGIHVGLGRPARCVTCDEPWPCPHATDVNA